MSPADSASSSSSSSSASEQLRIASLRQAVQASNSYHDHLALVHALRATGNLEATRQARESFADHHPLHPVVWLQWTKDELSLTTTPLQRMSMLRIFRRALDDFLSVPLHCSYHQVMSELFAQHAVDARALKTAFERSFRLGAFHHFTDGHQLWHIYHSFLTTTNDSPAFEKPIYKSHPSPLSSQFSEFEQKLNHARQHADPALLIHAYTSYAAFVQNVYPVAVISVYERMIADQFSNPTAWLHYLSYLTESKNNHHLSFVANRAVRNTPNCIQAWSHAVLSVSDHEKPLEKLQHILERAHPFVTNSVQYAAAEALTKNAWSVYLVLGAPRHMLQTLKRSLSFNVQNSVHWAAATCHAACVLVRANYLQDAVELFESVVHARPTECRWRLQYASAIGLNNEAAVRDMFESGMRHATSSRDIGILRDAWQAFEVSVPDREGFLHRLHRIDIAASKLAPHKQHVGVLDDVDRKRTNTRRDKVHDPKKRKKRTTSDYEMHIQEPPSAAQDGANVKETPEPMNEIEEDHRTTPSQTVEKGAENEQKEESDAKPTESRSHELKPVSNDPEPNTVFISNLPFNVKEEHLRDVFGDADHIRQIRIPLRSDGATKGIAYIEFEDEAAVQKALTKHLQAIHGRTISVKRSKPPHRRKKGSRPRGSSTRRRTMQPHASVRRRRVVSGAMHQDNDVEMSEDVQDAKGGGETTSPKPMNQDDFRAMLRG
ncbi:Squamous cell carcinoma antigen recognized by T-cells 3 [Gracilariopsis chorda]|uniref:Squamous cell carcinoma antigen recognized by T-cells 3 n=1 Tax=Gracilariopsis chorda TaxID=448386 RepID=A0A2V3J291_9FLOR|nr:Squamous cell carcinoma antigen recognized by T-cells 3 [Gracilariopsis chorda]|eukprot:PXF48463.1 Squamous cell carcinoma antigen recognized by T-cells 3 [Gracilariopsis chorda]